MENVSKLMLTLSQTDKVTSEQKVSEFVINIVNDAEIPFSAKYVRKSVQRAANNTLALGGKKLGISLGRRFKLSANFEGFEFKSLELYYNSSDAAKDRFNVALKAYLSALVIGVKEIME